MKEKGFEFNNTTPFFIDAQGHAFFTSARSRLDWSDFARVSGLGKVVSTTFRHHMSAIVMAQPNLAMVEIEEYALCHSKATQKRSYADQLALKANILKTQDWYANTVVPAGTEKLSAWVEENSAAYKRVSEMHKMHLAELENQRVLDMVAEHQTNKDLLTHYGRDGKLNIFNDRVKVALLDAILQAGIGFDGHRISGLSRTIFDNLLAAGTAIKNKKSAKVVRRLATLHLKEVNFFASVGSLRCTFITSVSNFIRFFIAVVKR